MRQNLANFFNYRFFPAKKIDDNIGVQQKFHKDAVGLLEYFLALAIVFFIDSASDSETLPANFAKIETLLSTLSTLAIVSTPALEINTVSPAYNTRFNKSKKFVLASVAVTVTF